MLYPFKKTLSGKLSGKKALLAAAVFALALISLFGAVCPKCPKTTNAVDAVNMSVTSRGAYLMDFKTGTPIFEYKATARHPIASMVKIMTLTLIYEEIEAGKMGYDDMIAVSQNAAGMGGSQAFESSIIRIQMNTVKRF